MPHDGSSDTEMSRRDDSMNPIQSGGLFLDTRFARLIWRQILMPVSVILKHHHQKTRQTRWQLSLRCLVGLISQSFDVPFTLDLPARRLKLDGILSATRCVVSK